jgi:hypothetical protein
MTVAENKPFRSPSSRLEIEETSISVCGRHFSG